MREFASDKPKRVHPYAWLWEPLESEPSFVCRQMFGTRAAYLDGKILLCFSARTEPWSGVLVATEREHHDSLRREFPSLVPHPILPKWLYLSESSARFDGTAERLVRLVRQRDPRIGVTPKAKPRKRSRR
ncbi:MAG TPA: hypothetical protein VHE61_19855 [Opitutaceae bacterium]|nr:hypothetical protein [Opitutaceae bacterium]